MNKLTEAYKRLTAKIFCDENKKSDIKVDILQEREGNDVSIFDDIRITNAKSGEAWTISRNMVPAETEEDKMYGRDFITTLKDGSGVTLDSFKGYVSDGEVPLIKYSDKNPYAKIYAMANKEIKNQHDKYVKNERQKEQDSHAAKSAVAQSKINSFINGGK